MGPTGAWPCNLASTTRDYIPSRTRISVQRYARLPYVANGWIAVPQTSHIISPSDVETEKALPNGTLPDIRLLILRDERRMDEAKVSIDLHAESSLPP